MVPIINTIIGSFSDIFHISLAITSFHSNWLHQRLTCAAYVNNAYVNNAYVNNAYVNNAYVNNAYVNNAYVNNAYVNNASIVNEVLVLVFFLVEPKGFVTIMGQNTFCPTMF